MNMYMDPPNVQEATLCEQSAAANFPKESNIS